MPAAGRKSDTGTGHGCFPATDATAGSPDVDINDLPALRVGDPFEAHGCATCPSHGRALSVGSGTVFINDKPAGRIGDAIDCGGAIASGSDNVDIG